MQFSRLEPETNILRSMVLIGVAFILVLAALPPALTAMMLEVYASSNEDDEESDDGGEDSSDSERAVPSDTSSQRNGEQDEDGDIVTYTDNQPDDPVFITSYRVNKDSSLGNDILNIIGEIRNTDSVSADFVELIATFYDATNSTLGSDFTFTDPTDLDPGQSAPFEMNAGISKDLPVDDVRYIKFHVDWQ